MTGPIARGDVNTVAAQVAAISEAAPDALAAFKSFGRVTAEPAGTSDVMREVLA